MLEVTKSFHKPLANQIEQYMHNITKKVLFQEIGKRIPTIERKIDVVFVDEGDKI